jgi:hypothetical protein
MADEERAEDLRYQAKANDRLRRLGSAPSPLAERSAEDVARRLRRRRERRKLLR